MYSLYINSFNFTNLKLIKIWRVARIDEFWYNEFCMKDQIIYKGAL